MFVYTDQAGFKTLEGFKEQKSQIRICFFRFGSLICVLKRGRIRSHNWFQMSLVPSLPYQVLFVTLILLSAPSNFQQRCTWKARSKEGVFKSSCRDDHQHYFLPHKIWKRKLCWGFSSNHLPQKIDVCWPLWLPRERMLLLCFDSL